MTNVKIKGEEAFKDEFKKFIEQVNKFKTSFQSFKEGVEEKRKWVNERSETWHEQNESFNSHLYDVEEFCDKVYDSLDIIPESYPNKLY